MKYFTPLIIVVLLFSGCQRKDETNKVIEGLPVNTSEIAVPAQAAQHYFLLKKDTLVFVIAILNRMRIFSNPSYPELQGSAPTFTFDSSNKKYGTARVSLTFRDQSNNPINPIGTQISSSTIASILIGIVPVSGQQFNYN